MGSAKSLSAMGQSASVDASSEAGRYSQVERGGRLCGKWPCGAGGYRRTPSLAVVEGYKAEVPRRLHRGKSESCTVLGPSC